jgi:hypothetical protein
MMVIDIFSLLEQSEQLSAQIQFCEVMAQKFAQHDRDVSKMYQSIAETLRKLESPVSQNTTSDAIQPDQNPS